MQRKDDYDVRASPPASFGNADVAACLEIIGRGEAVNLESATTELPVALVIAIARLGDLIVGVGAIKRVRRGYTAKIAGRSGIAFPSQTPELGYVAVHPDHRGHRLAERLAHALLDEYHGPLFATTSNPAMKATLSRVGFVHEGKEWDGATGRLSLWWKR